MSRHRSEPLVSVVMPVFNGETFLPEAIESILGQTFGGFELLVVDDGSTDGSREVAARFARLDSRVRPICGGHRGAVACMNEGVRRSRGQWVARMDQDDIALPDRLAVQLEWAAGNGLDVCGGQAERFGSREGVSSFPESHESITREMLFRCAVLYPTALVRTSLLRENGGITDCTFDDYELFTLLALCGRLGNVPSVLLRYRKHEEQTSRQRKKEMRRDFQRFRFRYFYRLHPRTPLADYFPLALVSDETPLRSLPDLERAGRWLAALGDSPDGNVRGWMGRRWRNACLRSQGLGDEVPAIFRRYRDRIGAEAEDLGATDNPGVAFLPEEDLGEGAPAGGFLPESAAP